MKGLKFLAACAAVGAVSVACAVSSLAADPTYQLTVSSYDAENGTIDITVPTEYTALVGGDYTLLVLTEAGNAATSITNENSGEVVQIQQGDSTILTGVKVGTDLGKGTYYVRVGGADATTENPTGFAAGTFKVGATKQVYIGDVDGNGAINTLDCTEIYKYLGDLTSKIADTDINYAAAAYCTGDENINTLDCTEIYKYLGDLSPAHVGNTVPLGTYATTVE